MTPPLRPAQMDRLRLRLRNRMPTAGLGAHIHRRMGQSLEFREFRDYVMGDDFRKVDWAASARHGQEGDLIVREFQAEERRRLVILADLRPAMRLPDALPKLVISAWVAQCLARAAMAEGDQVQIVPLFTRQGRDLLLSRPRDLEKLRRLYRTVAEAELSADDWATVPDIGPAGKGLSLKPASVVVLISDMLFADPGGHLRRLAAAAQESYRSLHVVELDAWPHERALLAAGPFRLGALAGRSFGEALSEGAESFLQRSDQALAEHRAKLRRGLNHGALVWPKQGLRYPAEPEALPDSAEDWFRAAFSRSAVLPSLLSRVTR